MTKPDLWMTSCRNRIAKSCRRWTMQVPVAQRYVCDVQRNRWQSERQMQWWPLQKVLTIKEKMQQLGRTIVQNISIGPERSQAQNSHPQSTILKQHRQQQLLSAVQIDNLPLYILISFLLGQASGQPTNLTCPPWWWKVVRPVSEGNPTNPRYQEATVLARQRKYWSIRAEEKDA